MIKPKIIGVTGGIGSGKTLIMNYLASKKIPVYIADVEAKKIVNYESTISLMKEIWGIKIFTNNVFDKSKLTKIVFNDNNQLKVLNNLIHPLVKTHWEKWLLQNHQFNWVAKESAILLEVDGRKYCDIVICVIATIKNRIERIMLRDNIDKEQANLKINSQWQDYQRIDQSDFVIQNNFKSIAIAQLQKILQKIIT